MRQIRDGERAPRAAPRHEDPEKDWRLIVIGMLALALLVVFSSAARAQTGTGSLLLHTPAGETTAPWLDTQMDVRVSGLVARVSVRQRFINDGTEWVEGVYLFPLPERAAVDGFRLRIGERLIEGELREREQARADYRAARAEGRRASLVEQQRPNVFRTSVANIAPRDTIEVELDYLQVLDYDAGRFSLRLPTTIVPRYEPAAPRTGAVEAMDTSAIAADAARITPAVLHIEDDHKALAGIHVDLAAGFALAELASAYHAIEVERDGTRYRVDLAAGKVPMDRDFELTWRPDVGARPAAAAFAETLDGEAYALVLFVPPARSAHVTQPREVILVIDTSGSMEGTALVQAKAALALALAGLGPHDRFNVIQFNSTTSSLYDAPVASDATTRAQARAYVEALAAAGGTEMAPALEAALQGDAPPGWLRQVVFVTDAGVANEDTLLEQIRTQLGRARLFTVGIGSAPNAYFMRKAAELGAGSFTVIGTEDEVGAKMQALLGKLEAPALTDIVLEWPGSVEAWPERVPDLYAGEPVLVSARLPRLAGDVVVRGNLAGQPWSATLSLDAAEHGAGVATVWARRRIEVLMDAERRGDANAQREIVDIALRHRLASRYTSFVAVDRTPVRPQQAALQRREVPNLLPAGWSDESVGYPQTATPAALHALASLVLFALGAALRWRRRPPAFP